MRRVPKFISDIYNKKELLLELAKRDFQQQYMGSYLGFIWIYLQPLLFVSVIYTIFSIGLKSSSTLSDVPFVVYLIIGIVPWFYISANLTTNTRVILQHSFLLKKVDFRLSILPIVNLISSFPAHIFLIFISIVVAIFNGIYPSLYIFQLIYYFLAMNILLLGIGWFTSSSQLFVSDISKIIGLIVTFGFWLTPIFWSVSKIPEQYQWIMYLNPFAYIVDGYRDSIYLDVGFWEKPLQTLFFWIITLSVMLIGITVFKKLRPHFAEVV